MNRRTLGIIFLLFFKRKNQKHKIEIQVIIKPKLILVCSTTLGIPNKPLNCWHVITSIDCHSVRDNKLTRLWTDTCDTICFFQRGWTHTRLILYFLFNRQNLSIDNIFCFAAISKNNINSSIKCKIKFNLLYMISPKIKLTYNTSLLYDITW